MTPEEVNNEELIKHYTHEARRLTHEQLIKWYALTARDMRNFQDKFISADQKVTELKEAIGLYAMPYMWAQAVDAGRLEEYTLSTAYRVCRESIKPEEPTQ